MNKYGLYIIHYTLKIIKSVDLKLILEHHLYHLFHMLPEPLSPDAASGAPVAEPDTA